MSKIKKILWFTGGLFTATVATAAYYKQEKTIARLEGENKILRDQVDKFRQDTIKKAAQQSYYNGRNAEKAANNSERN